MTAEDLQALYKAIAETESEKLGNFQIHELQSYRRYFFDAQQYILDVRLEARCLDRVRSIDREIEGRNTEKKADQRHREIHGVGTKTLWWSRVAGVSGIAGDSLPQWL